ncbi:MAG: carbohydrate kinase [Verrucomicrobia bacterium]|nr:carbohydrate kinase [Verrucomicrobiota bacterium]MBU4292052.1 carbohydrate kinase [Verrucomicrobiota bacterium]MBU4428149.1 carbohydrate kinase [Verrucomicrobiota bacterium]MCG2678886.1 carbohydrate kinase [Kiritimatiellia bacterium]
MKQRPTVVGIGEILWDCLPGGKQLGGAPANFVYHATALGAAGCVVSCVGDDPAGLEIGARLDALKLDRHGLAVDGSHPTGTVDVKVDADGKPRYIIHEHVAWDFIPWSEALRDLASKTDAVCYGSLAQRSEVSRKTIRAFLAATPPSCLRVFDVNLRQEFFNREIIQDTLSLSNILKISDEELPVVARLLAVNGEDEQVMKTLRSRYRLRLVALTRGAQGSVLVVPEGALTHSGVRVKVADTVGAGDAFTAGMVMGLLRGLDNERIHETANRLAAHVCSQPGATPTIPPSLGLDRQSSLCF